jgi:deferrochelatase/peroxidase EfeB
VAEIAVSAPAAAVELDDIQGLVRFAYKNHTEAVFLLLRIEDVGAARAWLARVTVTDATTRKPVPSTALQIALTSEGLRSLGIADDVINAFSPEFVNGMAGDTSRSRRLGDLGPSDPSRWHWGSGSRVPHVVVLLYALPGELRELQQTVETQLQTGFEIMHRLATSDMDGFEPFGFVDGISQPELDWGRQRAARDATELAYGNLSCLGEFLLGYPNEYGLYTTRPLLGPDRHALGNLPRAQDAPDCCDLGRNGTYLVIRQLRQNVHAFWQALDRYAGGEATLREYLASAMVGRKLNGEPLMEPEKPAATPPRSGATRSALNGFDYRADPDGVRCPFGAHIRRSNPRNADLPLPAAAGIVSRLMRTLGFDAQARRQDVVASTRFHRVLRRGREYGVSITPAQALASQPTAEDRGLQFICLGASIQRQFEFVQSAWLMSAKFNGLRDESDPLLGNRLPISATMPTHDFSLPQADGPDQRLSGLPQFVTVLGGAYCFLPGIRALRFLTTVR